MRNIKLYEYFNTDIYDRMDDCLAYFHINKPPTKAYYSDDLSMSSDYVDNDSEIYIIGYFIISYNIDSFSDEVFLKFKNRAIVNNLNCVFFKEINRLEFTFYEKSEFEKVDIDQFKLNMENEGYDVIII